MSSDHARNEKERYLSQRGYCKKLQAYGIKIDLLLVNYYRV